MRFLLLYSLPLFALLLPLNSLAQDTTALEVIEFPFDNILSVENDLMIMTQYWWEAGESLYVYDITDPNEAFIVDRGFSAYTQPEQMHYWTDDRATDAVIFDSLIVWCSTHSWGSNQFGVIESGPVDLWGRWMGTDENLWQIRLSDQVDGGILHPGNMIKYGDYLIVAAGAQRIRIYDLSNPEQPELVNVLNYYNDRIVLSGDRLLVYDGWTLILLDISIPEEPEEIGRLAIGNEQYPFSFPPEQVVNGCVFLPYWDGHRHHFSLLVLDIMAEDAPVEVARIILEREFRYYYFSIWDDKLYIKDAGTPYLDVYNLSEEYEISLAFTALVWGGNLNQIIAYENLLIFDTYSRNTLVYEVFPLSAPDNKILPPASFSLSFFPNPFNSTTTIRYELPCPGQVSLQIYNPSGHQITTLFEGTRQLGAHTTTLNAGNLPTGLYFVRLKVSDQVFTQKVMLIR